MVFQSVLEARARSALLLAFTYDPRISHGAVLMPLNHSNIAKRLGLPGYSQMGTAGSDLTMHR